MLTGENGCSSRAETVDNFYVAFETALRDSSATMRSRPALPTGPTQQPQTPLPTRIRPVLPVVGATRRLDKGVAPIEPSDTVRTCRACQLCANNLLLVHILHFRFSIKRILYDV